MKTPIKLFISLIVISISVCDAPIKIELYFESLCPGCRSFITDQIKTFLNTPGNELVAEISFIPYGNAMQIKSGSTYSFQCQHGEVECYGNLIETCAINLFQDRRSSSFIICLESDTNHDFDKAMRNCVETEEELNAMLECLSDPKSNEWQHEMADKTESLNPPHDWVPWVIVDGKVDAEIVDTPNLMQYLCSKRGDRSELPACSELDQEDTWIFSRFLGAKDICLA